MVSGSVVKCLGSLLACTSAKRAGFAATVVGQAAMALAQPHLVNSPACLGTEWFQIDERDFASTLGLLGNILGQALGEALSPIIVNSTLALGLSTSASVLVLCCVVLLPVVASGQFPPFCRCDHALCRRVDHKSIRKPPKRWGNGEIRVAHTRLDLHSQGGRPFRNPLGCVLSWHLRV